MKLYDGKLNCKYIIDEISVKESIMRRLEALGMNKGTQIQILNKKRKGAMVIKVRGTRLALGKSIISQIVIKEK